PAIMRSSRISVSSGFIRLGSIFRRRISPLPLSVTLTRPAPACPSTSSASSSACIFCMRSWSCCACFIIPIRSFMVSPLVAVSGLTVLFLSGLTLVLRLARSRPHGFDLGLRENVQDCLHGWVGSDFLKLSGCPLPARLPTRRLAWLAAEDGHPPAPGPLA